MLKKFLIGTFAVALMLTVVSVASASYDFGPSTLKVGSKGEYVKTLQTLVGASPVDGVFGNMTKAKVMAWQASNGLTADGVFGPASKAKANGTTTGGTTCPAGQFDPMTGKPCGSTTTYPAGCTSAVGYSTTTGVKCDSTTGGTPGVLSGEGTVKDFSIGSAEESTISEGQDNMELAAFDVELDNDGSLKLDRFDLYMGETNTGTESSKPWDYFTKAYLMADGNKIATMDVSSSSDWSEYDTGTLSTSSQEYRLRFAGLSTILKSNETTTISVAFDAVSNLDSADEGADWEYGIETDSFRFVDATGFVFTDGEDLADSFTFDTAEIAALKLSAATNDPKSSVIEVSKTSDTNGVVIGMFNVEETADVDANVTEMTVTLSSTTSETITDMVKKLYLYDGSTKVGEETVNSGTVTFDNIDLDVNGDSKVVLTVKADFDDTNDGVRYQDADTIKVDSVNLVKYTDKFENDESDIGAETGSYAGQSHALYSEGIMVTLDSTSATSVTVDSTNNDRAELTIKFKVAAFGADAYVVNAKTQTSVGTTSTTTAPSTVQGVGYHVQYTGTSPSTTESGATTLTSTADEKTNSFEVLEGQTETFTLKVVIANDGTPDLSGTNVRAILAGLGFASSDSATADSVYTFNLSDYKTDYAIIAD
jgi:peptidoglycan hydrolase-like protein with peptidoglycan-binding domain